MPIRGEATAVLSSGEKLTLKVNFLTMARICADLDMSADEVDAVLRDRKHPRNLLTLAKVVEVSLQRYHPDIGEDDLGDLLFTDGKAMFAAFESAMTGARGEAEQADTGANPPKPRRGTSTPSSKRGRQQA